MGVVAPASIAAATLTAAVLALTGGAAPVHATAADAVRGPAPTQVTGFETASVHSGGAVRVVDVAARRLRESKPASPRALSGSPRTIGRELAARRGWTGSQWTCLERLWTVESGWHVHASNNSSGAYGIPQALPGRKMASYGSDWRNSAATQIRWGLNYIADRYGSPCGAWNHSQSHNYY
jgi:hypothetical protein